MSMNSVRVFFAGDFCSTSSAYPITVSEELRNLIASCDLKVINFEVPLKPDVKLPPQKRLRFSQHDDVPDFLRGIGFNLFSIATNHTFDWGEAGYQKTMDVLKDAAFGAGSYNEAYKVKVVEVNGMKIGFLAFCFSSYTGVFDDVTNHEGLGCAYINDLKVNHVIIEAKQQVDYLFVLPHDGIEYIDIPLPETIARYRDFIDWGADAVIGTHPHCPQGWETYKDKPIFYSLGNFLFNSKRGYDYRAWNRPHWYEGLCVIMTIKDGMLSWEIVNIKNVDNLAIEIDFEDARNKHNETICQYLLNKECYCKYLERVCKDLGSKEQAIVDKTIHHKTLLQCTKLLLKCWINKLMGKNVTNDYYLLRLLKHDTRRHLLVWTLKQNQKNV